MKNIILTTLAILPFCWVSCVHPGTPPKYIIERGEVYHFDPWTGGRILVEGADPKTFEQLSYEWGKDANYVFLNHQKVPSIDRRSFRNVKGRFYRDKNYIYNRGGGMSGDPDSLVVLKDDAYMRVALNQQSHKRS